MMSDKHNPGRVLAIVSPDHERNAWYAEVIDPTTSRPGALTVLFACEEPTQRDARLSAAAWAVENGRKLMDGQEATAAIRQLMGF